MSYNVLILISLNVVSADNQYITTQMHVKDIKKYQKETLFYTA